MEVRDTGSQGLPGVRAPASPGSRSPGAVLAAAAGLSPTASRRRVSRLCLLMSHTLVLPFASNPPSSRLSASWKHCLSRALVLVNCQHGSTADSWRVGADPSHQHPWLRGVEGARGEPGFGPQRGRWALQPQCLTSFPVTLARPLASEDVFGHLLSGA